MKKVLNVGGNSREIPLPPIYAGWDQCLLDIDPRGNPDILCDARELAQQPAAAFDAVYCSHNLEHYYRHDVRKVLAGFAHVLKPGGFVHIVVPDIAAVMRHVVGTGMDIGDVLYQSPAGPIAVLDVIYGYGVEIERSGNPFYAHKTGFSQQSLIAALQAAGFAAVYSGTGNFEVVAYGFVGLPPAEHARLLGLPVATA